MKIYSTDRNTKLINNKIIKDIRRQTRKDIFNSNIIEHQYDAEIIQKRIMHDDNKKDKE